MQDFYCADQSEEESIPSFATQIEGLSSQIRDRFPDKLPCQEEQRLLRDHLFHGCKKNIWDSVKFYFADLHLDYTHFLEECRKAEEEGNLGQAKAVTNAKLAAATLPPTEEDELAKQLKYQQHQIDALVGHVKNLVSVVKATVLLQRGQAKWFLEATPKNMERGFQRKEPASTDPILSHTSAMTQEPPGRAGGWHVI